MAFKYIIEEVRRLSQEEGLNDGEIAEKIGCSKSTIGRVRADNNIPKCNLKNKKDKSYICSSCSKQVFIARREKVKLYCKECKEKRQ